jgi:hypothetical protein
VTALAIDSSDEWLCGNGHLYLTMEKRAIALDLMMLVALGPIPGAVNDDDTNGRQWTSALSFPT